jgi:putative FmdB family regulatory protein
MPFFGKVGTTRNREGEGEIFQTSFLKSPYIPLCQRGIKTIVIEESKGNMPLYTFYCKKCDKTFDIFLRPSEASGRMPCPSCQGDDAERLSDKEQDNLTPGVCGVKKDT